jgi:RNA polymerase sigma-70 factor (ECF subfamily)
VYCVVSEDLAPELHELLRDHWRGDPTVVVVSERRRGERRASSQGGRRRIRERRADPVAEPPADLPRLLHPHASRLRFAPRATPGRRDAEDIDSDRLVVRFQGGEVAAFDELYIRYFDRVYAYARVALHDDYEAEDVAQQVFGNVIQALPRYQVRDDASFRSWLFRIARNMVLRTASRNGRMRPQEPAELDRRLECPTPLKLSGLDWLSDKDLEVQIERLPVSQRQVILLRYVFEFNTDEIADALDRTAVAIRMLEHRAMRALEARLHALRGTTRRCDRASMVMRRRPLPVLAMRRVALHGCGAVSL